MNDLEQLKQLLFGEEKQALDSIAARVEHPEVRTADVADVLPEAIHRSHARGGELVESLTEPVGECLKQAFHDDPQTYGDALYPVMGPAIRKSILHTLRSFAQQINEAVEHSVSPQGLRWRWEARRAGIPFGQYLLQKTLRYRVEQAYLISRENGLLVAHVHHEASRIKDSDAVSAMFTAIQDFVKESFSPDRTGRLESADMGEFTLWAVHGPHALLVCVIRGVPPRSLRSDLSAILERIHFRYGDAIRDYKGDTSSVPEVETELERCLRFEARHEKQARKKGLSPTMLILLLAILAAAIWFGVKNWQINRDLEALRTALATTPGIHITELRRGEGGFVLHGLRDPLAESVAAVASAVNVDAERLQTTLTPFQSLEPDIVLRRARSLFADQPAIELQLVESTLAVSGTADWRAIEQLRSQPISIAGVDAIDWSGLEATDREQFRTAVAALDGRIFYFEDAAELRIADREALSAYATELAALAAESRNVGYRLRVEVIGATDGTGTEQGNVELAAARVAAANAVLNDAGVVADAEQYDVPAAGDGAAEPARRHVRVELSLEDAAGVADQQ